MNFRDIRKLEDRVIKEDERWIYSAGFNVKSDLKSSERIDSEIEDIWQISNSGGICVILSHQGRYVDKDVIHLDFVARYLSDKLGKEVKYFPENNTKDAFEFSNSLKEEEIALMGNTRFHEGEEKNDIELAKQFAKLGDFVAIGGWNKAHRRHSSNVGILNYREGFITRNHLREMELLKPWSGKREGYSVAILGGVKGEKISIGLRGLINIYDYIIPGGIVLNTILKVKGYEIGDSVIKDSGKSFEKDVEGILDENKIYVPSRVFIAKRLDLEDRDLIDISRGVPEGYMIVDYIFDDISKEHLEKAERILLAGTPCFYRGGFEYASMQCLKYLEKPNAKSIVLGGDSINEIPFNGTKSSGGGSSLEFLCKRTTAVYEALIENKQKFG